MSYAPVCAAASQTPKLTRAYPKGKVQDEGVMGSAMIKRVSAAILAFSLAGLTFAHAQSLRPPEATAPIAEARWTLVQAEVRRQALNVDVPEAALNSAVRNFISLQAQARVSGDRTPLIVENVERQARKLHILNPGKIFT